MGGSHEIAADVRIIVATNRNLEEMVPAQTSREDLLLPSAGPGDHRTLVAAQGGTLHWMTEIEALTAEKIDAALSGNAAYKRLGPSQFVVKQGSTFVMLTVCLIDGGHAQVRCLAQLVKGVHMTPDLAYELLKLNTQLSFGAFGYSEGAQLILLTNSLLGGETLDADEITSTLESLVKVADEYDDKIIATYGGQRMTDLLEASQLGKLFSDPNASAF